MKTLKLCVVLSAIATLAHADDGRENLIGPIAKIQCYSVFEGNKNLRVETVKRDAGADGMSKSIDIIYHNAKGNDLTKGEHIAFHLDTSYHLEADTIEILGKNAKGQLGRFLVDEREEAVDADGFAYAEFSINGKKEDYLKFVCKVDRAR